MRNLAWANHVRKERKGIGLTRRKLAELAKIDPSYVTLIERDGYVPRRDKVLDIAKALGTDTDKTLLVAGYAPLNVPLGDLLARVEEHRLAAGLRPEVLAVVTRIAALNWQKQRKVAQGIEALLAAA